MYIFLTSSVVGSWRYLCFVFMSLTGFGIKHGRIFNRKLTDLFLHLSNLPYLRDKWCLNFFITKFVVKQL